MGARIKWFLALSLATFVLQVQAQCNPLQSFPCAPIPVFNSSDYFVDFTTASSIPADWIIADSENVTLDSDGAKFQFSKRYDAPYMWTASYMLFGKVDVVMKAAGGTGIISSAVLLSDDWDEIDWEFSGNNFNAGNPRVQTNYFGKGVLGSWDRGTLPQIANDPTADFHTYSLDWSPTKLVWSIDGTVIRTLEESDCNTSDHQYPQSPSRLHLGVWDGGDPSNAGATIFWAGGYTDFTQAPFTMNVKSVHIQTTTPAPYYNYTDSSGSYTSIKAVNYTAAASSAILSASVAAAPSDYTGETPPSPTQSPVATNCNRWYLHNTTEGCYDIATAHNLTLAQFYTYNPAVGTDCSNLWANYYACVGINDSRPSTTAITSSMGAPVSSVSSTVGDSPSMAPSSTTLSSSSALGVSSYSSSASVESQGSTSTASGPSATALSCPGNNSTKYDSADGSVFIIECSYDRPFGDINQAFLNSFQACVDLCASTGSACLDAAWGPAADLTSNGTCWIKNQVNEGAESSNRWGARRLSGPASTLSSASSSSPSFSSTAGSTTTNGLSTASAYSATGAAALTATTSSTTGYVTSVPLNPPTSTGSTASLTSAAVVASFTSSSRASASASSSTLASSTASTCPSMNSSSQSAPSNDTSVYEVECGIDRAYGDLLPASAYMHTFPDCLDFCESTQGCIGAEYHSDTGACWLKAIKTSPYPNANVWGGIRSGASNGSVSNMTSPSCPSGNSTMTMTGAKSTYIVECGVDRPWGDINSKSDMGFSDCLNWCDGTNGCVAVSWHSDQGTCWLKNAVNGPSLNSVVWGAVRQSQKTSRGIKEVKRRERARKRHWTFGAL